MSRVGFLKAPDRLTKIGEMVHSDVCGPMRVCSLGKERYFVTFMTSQDNVT